MNNELSPAHRAKLARLLPEVVQLIHNDLYLWHVEDARIVRETETPYLISLAEAKLTAPQWDNVYLHHWDNRPTGAPIAFAKYLMSLTPAQRIDALPEPE
jgi:hypothetical protein